MALIGHVDQVIDGKIRGWAFDPEAPDAAVEVVLKVADDEIARTNADIFRKDLLPHGIGDGHHGFEVALPRTASPSRISARFARTDKPIPGSFAEQVSPARRMRTPRAENPLLDQLLEEDPLPADREALLREFAKTGFLKFRVTDPDFDSLAKQAVEEVDWSRSNGIRFQDAWSEVEAVRRLATLPEVMDMLELLYGRQAVPFQTLSFRVGTQQETHSDSIHFSSQPARFMCGVWIALEPIDRDNGALHYYPGSHRLPILDLNDLGLIATPEEIDTNYQTYVETLQSMISAHGPRKEVAIMDRGEAIIWAANLYHGGEPIRDPGRTRFSQVTHYYFEGCSYFSPLTSNPAMNQLVRPERRDVRTRALIPHRFEGLDVGPASITVEDGTAGDEHEEATQEGPEAGAEDRTSLLGKLRRRLGT